MINPYIIEKKRRVPLAKFWLVLAVGYVIITLGMRLVEAEKETLLTYDEACRRECWDRGMEYEGIEIENTLWACNYFCRCNGEGFEICGYNRR